MSNNTEKLIDGKNVWDYVSHRTKIDRTIIKDVILGLLFGRSIIDTMCDHRLTIDQVVEIRMRFDDFTTNWVAGK